MKSLILWIATVIFTLLTAYYQRLTGPTYPISGKTEIGNEVIKYKLIRTYGGSDNAEIAIEDPGGKLEGTLKFKRYKSFDEWAEMPMVHLGGKLVGYLPHQPPAGKIEYYVKLSNGTINETLTDEPVVIRFKGDVPAGVLIPHIILMFLAMLFSSRTGAEVLFKGGQTFKYAIYTTIFLFVGGLILGPMVQKHAFGEYWTGFPFGYDLTDNKTAIAFIFWIIALFMLWRNPKKKGWALVAAIVLLMVYVIPHSTLGSEIDHTALPK